MPTRNWVESLDSIQNREEEKKNLSSHFSRVKAGTVKEDNKNISTTLTLFCVSNVFEIDFRFIIQRITAPIVGGGLNTFSTCWGGEKDRENVGKENISAT